MAEFVIVTDKSGMYRFSLKASNNEIILRSESYTTKSACKNGILSVRLNSRNDRQYVRKIASNSEPYFILKANNGEVIGISETYSSNQALEKGIESVKLNAKDAKIVDNMH